MLSGNVDLCIQMKPFFHTPLSHPSTATTSLLVSQLAELAPPLTRLLTTEIALCQQCMLEFPTLPNMYVVQKLELQVVKLIRAK